MKRVRQEAEAKRREEERKAKEDAEKKKKQELEKWQKKVDEIKKSRESERISLLEQYDNEYKSAVEEIQNKKDSDIAEVKKQIAELKDKIEYDKTELNGLGFFKFGRKKELRLSIETDTKTMYEIEYSIPTIEKKAEEDCSNAEISYKQKKDNLDSELDKKYVIPDSPEEAERKRKEKEERRAKMLEIEKKNEEIKQIILDVLNSSNEPMKVSEIIRDYELYERHISVLKAAPFLGELVNEGKVRRVNTEKITKYEII